METVSLLGMLGICSIEDLMKKQVHVAVIGAFGILGVLLHLYYGTRSTMDMLGGMAVGVGMYLVSLLSRESVGKGDALLLTVSGVYLGFWGNMALLWLGTLFAGIAGLFLYAIRHKKPRYRLPFVPFVLAAYFVLLCCEALY